MYFKESFIAIGEKFFKSIILELKGFAFTIVSNMFLKGFSRNFVNVVRKDSDDHQEQSCWFTFKIF